MWLFYLPSIASYNIKIIANSRRKSKPLKQLFCVNFVSDLTVLGWQNLSREKQFQPQKRVRHLSPPLWIHWKTSQSISQKGIRAKLRLLSHCLAFHVVQRFSRSVLTRLSRSTRQCLDQLWSSEQYQRGNEAWLSCKRHNNNKAKTWRALSLYH